LDADGRIIAASTIARDITERKEAERRQKLLTDELQHRIKNTLAAIRAMCTQTLRSSQSLEEFSKAFDGRLSAMARGHDLLTRSKWEGAGLLELVAGELTPHRAKDRENIIIECGDVQLKPRTALTLGMVLHELTANAVKYGALSSPSGRLEVTCKMENTGENRRLRVMWVESGGPEIAGPPNRRGFGSELIERSAAYQLGGQARLEFRKKGLRCTIEVPFTEQAGVSL
jgi:two-component sensor histidine kinase